MKHKASSFLELLNSFVTEYLPGAVGASPNTIKSYKAAFRLLLKYMYQEKSISADQKLKLQILPCWAHINKALSFYA
ncbi:hypothetical protein [Ruminiclostridium cellobioparum]|uniref:Core-binding (CB) domain-containing protein n=1 Tax=Ruminiclostridium cellobioparum subsp. termitidis CT1112 TaxID=1195236 RepID=S0FF30_RUMCE|nr:hypothetical protein [Ruminiclostridium cellobioparum]EMS69260.1 hypothetical protein CTER_5095 [Ruminiclostridium cellobioparum subsp. termitidis CT1112]